MLSFENLNIIMKQLLFVIGLAAIIALNTSAQNDTIPNGGFDNWQSAGTGEDPVDWGSRNQQSQN